MNTTVSELLRMAVLLAVVVLSGRDGVRLNVAIAAVASMRGSLINQHQHDLQQAGARTSVGLSGIGLSWRVEHTPDLPAVIPAERAEGLPNGRRLRPGQPLITRLGWPAMGSSAFWIYLSTLTTETMPRGGFLRQANNLMKLKICGLRVASLEQSHDNQPMTLIVALVSSLALAWTVRNLVAEKPSPQREKPMTISCDQERLRALSYTEMMNSGRQRMMGSAWDDNWPAVNT